MAILIYYDMFWTYKGPHVKFWSLILLKNLCWYDALDAMDLYVLNLFMNVKLMYDEFL